MMEFIIADFKKGEEAAKEGKNTHQTTKDVL